MRALLLMPLIALAGCGGDTGNKAKAADTLPAGQYEITAEVTSLEKVDQGTPKINTPAGTRATRSVCLANPTSPPPDFFADDGMTCQARGPVYVRGGSISGSLGCTRPDLRGDVGYTFNGTFDAQGFQVQRQLATRLATEGDVVVKTRLQGRRTGDCSAAAPPANGAAPK